jgi:hypothetical protein
MSSYIVGAIIGAGAVLAGVLISRAMSWRFSSRRRKRAEGRNGRGSEEARRPKGLPSRPPPPAFTAFLARKNMICERQLTLAF